MLELLDLTLPQEQDVLAISLDLILKVQLVAALHLVSLHLFDVLQLFKFSVLSHLDEYLNRLIL